MRRLHDPAGRKIWQLHDATQERWPRCWYSPSDQLFGLLLAAGRQPKSRNVLRASDGHSGPRFDEGGKPLRKHFSWAVWISTVKLAHRQQQLNLAPCTRRVAQHAAIV